MQFSDPYLEFNQGVAVNRECTPVASAESDLRGLTAGIQVGNTSDFVARRWVMQGVIAGIRYYPYDGIQTTLNDLEAGNIGLVIKLFPVISCLTKSRPNLEVSIEVPTHEQLGIAFAKGNVKLCNAVNGVLQVLHSDGEFDKLQARWFSK